MAHTLKTAALMLVAVVILALATSIPAAADQIDTITFLEPHGVTEVHSTELLKWTPPLGRSCRRTWSPKRCHRSQRQGASDGFVGQTYLYNVSGRRTL